MEERKVRKKVKYMGQAFILQGVPATYMVLHEKVFRIKVLGKLDKRFVLISDEPSIIATNR